MARATLDEGSLLMDYEIRWMLDNPREVRLVWQSRNQTTGEPETAEALVCECIQGTQESMLRKDGREVSDAMALVIFILANAARPDRDCPVSEPEAEHSETPGW